MRWNAKPDGDGWKRRLLIVPMKYGEKWIWLEMVRMHFFGYFTAVLTEEDYQKQK